MLGIWQNISSCICSTIRCACDFSKRFGLKKVSEISVSTKEFEPTGIQFIKKTPNHLTNTQTAQRSQKLLCFVVSTNVYSFTDYVTELRLLRELSYNFRECIQKLLPGTQNLWLNGQVFENGEVVVSLNAVKAI